METLCKDLVCTALCTCLSVEAAACGFVACDGERKRSQRASATCCPLRLPLDRYCRRPSLTCAAANAALRNRSLLLHTQKARAAVRDLRGRWGWDGHKLKMSERLANTSADTLTSVAATRSKFITCFLICGWLTVFVCVPVCCVCTGISHICSHGHSSLPLSGQNKK